MTDEFERLWIDVGLCKASGTCPRLTIRNRWFEPNPGTLAQWRAEERFVPSIDRRVMFVCESPTQKASVSGVFRVPGVGIAGARCWGGDNAIVTEDFWRARRQFGLEHTWITNVVKCGAGAKCKPSDPEISACSTFLRRELELIQPAVLAIVGKSKTKEIYERSINTSVPRLENPPTLVVITHYSYGRRPGGRGHMMEIWAPEFRRIVAEQNRRALSEPIWL